MNFLNQAWHNWRKDRLLQSVVRNTGYLFSSNTIAMGLGMIQSIFAARLLGVTAFGVVGTITVFASTVNRLFSFRMGELVVKYMGEALARDRRDTAAAVARAALLGEALTSVLAFVVLALLAPLGAQIFAKDAALAPLFTFYGISVLGSLVAETSTGVLQVTNRFRSQAGINLAQSVLTALIIFAAFVMKSGMWVVVLAYLVGKLILGIGPAVLAWRALNETLGAGWWRTRATLPDGWRPLARFAVSTNLSATVNLLVRDSELLWVSFFLSPTEAGFYKVALAIINLVLMPITPFISTTFPEISRSVATKAWAQLRTLLRRVTILAGGWTLAVGLGLVLLGRWLILLYGAEYQPAYPAMLVLLLGFGAANTFFWNRPLLLALGHPVYPFQVVLWTGLAKLALAFLLVPRYGYVMEAALLSAYFVVSVALILARGGQLLRRAEAQPVVEAA